MSRHLIHQLIDKDNWESVDMIDSFLFIFDRMPKQMKLIVDLKMTGETNKEIAQKLKISEHAVRDQVRKAKKRLVTALF